MRNGSLKSKKLGTPSSKTTTKTKPTPLRDDSDSNQANSSSSGILVSPTAHLRPRSTTATRFLSMISPRSSNYERLEGGLGPSRTGAPSKRFAWKKVAVAAFVLIGLVFLFGPRERRESLVGEGKQQRPMDVPSHGGFEDHHHEDEDDLPTHPVDHSTPHSPPSETTHHPITFAEDPNPSLTTHCTSPHSSTSPLVQWALMIDAGSTGSRIHIYKFHNCLSSPSFEYEVFHQIHPGLSAFSGNPEGAARSLDPLMKEALKVVPKKMQSCTPVAVKATAGLRLLPGQASHDILDAVESRLRKVYPFQLKEKDGVVIMDGKEEGVYAWITANYLLGTIGRGDEKGSEKSTYAVLDLGGASTQIVFEPSFSPSSSKHSSSAEKNHLEDGEHKYILNFMGHQHILYQHSYLGYGLMRARKSVHTLVEFMARMRVIPGITKVVKDKDGSEVVANPCLAVDTQRTIEVPLDLDDVRKSGEIRMKNVTMSGLSIGSFESCTNVLQLVLAKDSVCEVKPCSFNGVYQPNLLDSFPADRGKVLLLSYFYDRVWPLLYPEGLSPTKARSLQPSLFASTAPFSPLLSISTISSLASQICQGPSSWKSHPSWSLSPGLLSELAGRPEWCLDLTFMYTLLRLGYEFEEARPVRVEKQVEGTELGWCLGAGIGLVGEAGWRCTDFDGEGGDTHLEEVD